MVYIDGIIVYPQMTMRFTRGTTNRVLDRPNHLFGVMSTVDGRAELHTLTPTLPMEHKRAEFPNGTKEVKYLI